MITTHTQSIATLLLLLLTSDTGASINPTKTSTIRTSTNTAASTKMVRKIACYETPQWAALVAASHNFKSDDKLHLRNLCSDSARMKSMVATHLYDRDHEIILDYSRQQVTGETIELLFDLADKIGLTDKRDAMRCGKAINTTEKRCVLHHVLRMPQGYDYGYLNPQGNGILKEVHSVRDRIHIFSKRVRGGDIRGSTGKILKNVIAIGIGGSQLGPEFVHEALRGDRGANRASSGRTLRFLSNVDPVDFSQCVEGLDPEETLVIVVSKTFTTRETMLNARTVKKWLTDAMPTAADVVGNHMVAVSTNKGEVLKFGIKLENCFQLWDWVGGRFSVCSAVGLLPLSLQYSYDIMKEFLAGAHDMDEHFFEAPVRENIPVILGLLGVWNSTFLGYATRALLPYSQALKRFPAHVQQVDMESNGKRVSTDGTPLPITTGEIDWGQVGTNGQHSFYQMLHQGRVVPVDFIGFCESQTPVELEGEMPNHDELMCNFFAQPDALAYGKKLDDLIQEGVPEELRQHKVFPGNRPSSCILMTKLDPFAIGQLLVIYEHRTAVQGFIWGINSFDQMGVELGKALAGQIMTQIQTSRNSGASVQGFNIATTSMLKAYIDRSKNNK